ncbi:MAG: transglycosylase SLT domain-containing protein [Candidatus Accumulibacter sp.]|nr:transglycosylase SLT domain-containing protein [Accumulibacter sp.]
MSVSVTLQKSMARGLDAVSSITQHVAMIAGLLFLLGVTRLIFGSPAEIEYIAPAPVATAAAAVPVAAPGDAAVQAAPAPAADALAAASSAEMKPHYVGMLEYIKRRYRVSPEAVLPVFEAAETVGRERRIDPILILAIIGVESSFNPFAESAMGARGLMQIIPRFHMDKFPAGKGVRHLFEPAVNISVGVQVLEEAIRRRGGLTAGLQSYSGSSDSEGRYANKVLAEKARLEKAARRGVEPTT